MPLREDILAPIAGENPSGIDLRYDNKLLIFDKIKEARRKDDELEQGAWQIERKTANYPLVIKLAQETLATTIQRSPTGRMADRSSADDRVLWRPVSGDQTMPRFVDWFLGHDLPAYRGWRS